MLRAPIRVAGRQAGQKGAHAGRMGGFGLSPAWLRMMARGTAADAAVTPIQMSVDLREGPGLRCAAFASVGVRVSPVS